MLAFSRRLARSCSPLALLGLAPLLSACPTEDPPAETGTETDTGEPSCLDTDTPGPDIVINSNADIQELQLSECVPETILISGGQVTNLTPLSTLREVKTLDIRFNTNLTTLQGLENLIRVDTLIITGHPNMASLIEFSDLAQVDHIIVTGNSGLADLGSFPALSSLGGRLEISGNDALTDLSGFESLLSINGDFDLTDQGMILDFAGLENLVAVGGTFRIEDNAMLESFDGLGVTNVGGDLRILTNEDLSECLVDDYITTVEVGAATVASGNKEDICD